MTIKQLQVSPPVAMALGIYSAQVTEQIRQTTKRIADSSGENLSIIELELYALTLCSCIYGLICQQHGDQPLALGQAARIQEKLKQLAVNLVVNELQDNQPQPSEN